MSAAVAVRRTPDRSADEEPRPKRSRYSTRTRKPTAKVVSNAAQSGSLAHDNHCAGSGSSSGCGDGSRTAYSYGSPGSSSCPDNNDSEPALDAGKVERMKVIDLRRLCGTMKLSQMGKKNELIERIIDALKAMKKAPGDSDVDSDTTGSVVDDDESDATPSASPRQGVLTAAPQHIGIIELRSPRPVPRPRSVTPASSPLRHSHSHVSSPPVTKSVARRNRLSQVIENWVPTSFDYSRTDSGEDDDEEWSYNRDPAFLPSISPCAYASAGLEGGLGDAYTALIPPHMADEDVDEDALPPTPKRSNKPTTTANSSAAASPTTSAAGSPARGPPRAFAAPPLIPVPTSTAFTVSGHVAAGQVAVLRPEHLVARSVRGPPSRSVGAKFALPPSLAEQEAHRCECTPPPQERPTTTTTTTTTTTSTTTASVAAATDCDGDVDMVAGNECGEGETDAEDGSDDEYDFEEEEETEEEREAREAAAAERKALLLSTFANECCIGAKRTTTCRFCGLHCCEDCEYSCTGQGNCPWEPLCLRCISDGKPDLAIKCTSCQTLLCYREGCTNVFHGCSCGVTLCSDCWGHDATIHDTCGQTLFAM